MDYAKINSTYYCGIDLHARSMYVCVMDNAGEIQIIEISKTTSRCCWTRWLPIESV